MVKQTSPDIILLDLRMPDMSGLEVLLQAKERNIDKPIVMLTTSNDESDLIKALRTGAQGYLLKDMEPDELVGAYMDRPEGPMGFTRLTPSKPTIAATIAGVSLVTVIVANRVLLLRAGLGAGV